MIFFRRVAGDSMTPILRDGQITVCHRFHGYKPGQIVIAFVDGREVIKRIAKIQKNMVFLVVDDEAHAHHGKYYAKIQDNKIVGVVFWPRNL